MPRRRRMGPCRAAAAAWLLLGSLSAHADDKVFRAMAMLLAGGPQAPLGAEDQGVLVELYTFAGGSAANMVLPGADPCVAEQWTLTDRDGAWADSVLATFDFRKISGVRWLAETDDYQSGPSRDENDPAVTTANLDGVEWNCQRFVKVDPASPTFGRSCNDGWTIVLVAPSDKALVREAIDVVKRACFAR